MGVQVPSESVPLEGSNPEYHSYCGLVPFGYRNGSYSKGAGMVDCSSYMRDLDAYSSIKRLRWYGWQFLDDDYSSCVDCYGITSISRWYCVGAGGYKYRVYAEATADDYSGNHYYARGGDEDYCTLACT